MGRHSKPRVETIVANVDVALANVVMRRVAPIADACWNSARWHDALNRQSDFIKQLMLSCYLQGFNDAVSVSDIAQSDALDYQI